MNNIGRPPVGCPPGKYPNGKGQLAIRMERKLLERINRAARASGKSTRIFVLSVLDRAIKRVEKKER